MLLRSISSFLTKNMMHINQKLPVIAVIALFLPTTNLSKVFAQTTVAAQSCGPTGGRALTKADIESRGRNLGFRTVPNDLEYAFENFARDSINEIPNRAPFYSDARESATRNYTDPKRRHRFVIPDALGPVVVRNRNQYGQIISSTPYSLSAFEEIKFTARRIYLSSFDHQITGFIDVLGTSLPASQARVALPQNRPTPRLTFHTPADTTIAPSVLSGANRVRVGIWQQVACDVPGTSSSTDMRMGAAVLLNPGVYAGSAPPTAVPPGRVAGLRR